MDNLVGPWKGHGGTSGDDGTYHGLRETKNFSSLYYPREHNFEDRREKVKKIIDVGPWQGYSRATWDDGTYHGEREITIEESTDEKIEGGLWGGNGGTRWDDRTYHGEREMTIEENRDDKTEVGLWGGNGGTRWDDGTYNGVRKITLVFGHCIDSICVVYDKNGMPVAAEKHGGVGGNQTTEIKLQSPGEYLVSISGYYSPMVRGASPVIRSLTFKSNKRTFGPFGMEKGTPFSSPEDGSRITGFKGRSGQHLNAIGLHKGQRGQHLDAIWLDKGRRRPDLAAIGMDAFRAISPNEHEQTISFPNRPRLDSHIQGPKLAAPAYYGHPRVPTIESTPSPALLIRNL